MKLERSWLCFWILVLAELQLETNQQVCIPLIPLKEIRSQMITSWVEIVSKVFLCFFLIFSWDTVLFHRHFFRLSFYISFDFHQVCRKYVSMINRKLLRWTVPQIKSSLWNWRKKEKDRVGVASISLHFLPPVLPKIKVTITAVKDPQICSTKRKLKQNKNKLRNLKYPEFSGSKFSST